MLQCRTTNSKIFGKIGTEESQIDASIELSEGINLFIKQNTYFLSNSPNDLILSCKNISVMISHVLIYFGISNNLRMLLLLAILNFLIAVTVPLYHIVEQHILEQKDSDKVHFTSVEHLVNFLDKLFMFA